MSSRSRPEQPVFFVDRSLGKHTVAQALRRQGAIVHTHDDHFPQDATDPEWLAEVGRRGWVVLTKDKNIRRREIERTAALQAGLALFVLTVPRLTDPEMAQLFAGLLPRMSTLALRRPRPFIAAVTRGGVRVYKMRPA